jgi:hypothetical protein
MLILPDETQRWPKVLHWLAWAGEVMPAERWADSNGRKMPFDKWDELQLGPRPRSFYSLIDNLFLRSAAALEWIVAKIARGDIRHSAPIEVAEPRRPRRGRPADTNQKEDRRVADAWRSGAYATYEDLARALNKTKREVELALDRDRKRRNK